jgi:hypothetical protein
MNHTRDAERGSATVLVLGVLVATVVVLVTCLAACARSVVQIRAATSADAAATAAAATAIGLGPGDAAAVEAGAQVSPCTAAARVASATGMKLGSCRVDRAVATVRVLSGSGAFAVGATARAGPAEPVRYI